VHVAEVERADPRFLGGCYTQPDPIGLLLLREGQSFFAGGFTESYGYSRERPLTFTDPIGLAVEVCCRPLKKVPVGNHCFIKVDGIPSWTMSIQRVGDRATKFFNYPDDVGGTCKSCECIQGQDQIACLLKAYADYPDNQPYPIFFGLTGPNSNTFAATLARKCCKNGFPVGLPWAPGANFDPDNPVPGPFVGP
jgi:hypothetical protein